MGKPTGLAKEQLRALAAMKVATAANRGLRRDFWDLHEIATKSMSLSDVVEAYFERFGVQRLNLYHVIRALTWFDDAESDPVMPRGLTQRHWSEIKAWFRRNVPPLVRDAAT